MFTYPEPKNYDELRIWQQEAQTHLRLLSEQVYDLKNMNNSLSEIVGQLGNKTADLEEWHKTFAPYGQEPQACLHTLLTNATCKPATSTEELYREAKYPEREREANVLASQGNEVFCFLRDRLGMRVDPKLTAHANVMMYLKYLSDNQSPQPDTSDDIVVAARKEGFVQGAQAMFDLCKRGWRP